ncbi:hypothetical protein PAMC26510_26175 [Caballeronia sordidicola]|uniref:Uncharacterized protein n=1 Tax=Caballeronia sordidicola TaxID=196367 RepID=A0A242MFG9_CABSO|nr:hypothetical protein PAMC26510_26175 [Caballeronia sordidicola]
MKTDHPPIVRANCGSSDVLCNEFALLWGDCCVTRNGLMAVTPCG